ncbi:MAG: His/Gly/Thr/Pro-type tRNA ligase C-terminal domain-containing protein, partial [Candidatus Aenigmatarchaeota archaeon]
MEGVILNFRLSNHNKNWNQVIVEVEGINSREEAKKLFEELTKENIRAEILSEGTIEYRVRDAEMRYIPYIIVIGKKEIESGNLTIRYRGTLFSMNKEE